MINDFRPVRGLVKGLEFEWFFTKVSAEWWFIGISERVGSVASTRTTVIKSPLGFYYIYTFNMYIIYMLTAVAATALRFAITPLQLEIEWAKRASMILPTAFRPYKTFFRPFKKDSVPFSVQAAAACINASMTFKFALAIILHFNYWQWVRAMKILPSDRTS